MQETINEIRTDEFRLLPVRRQSIHLPSEHFNVIFLVTVIGEVEHQDVYLQEFHRLLRPGGILSFSEQAGDPDKLSVKEISSLVEDVGFSFDRFYGSERNYTINFRKQ